MSNLSNRFLDFRKIFETNTLEKEMNNSFHFLRVRVGTYYDITIDNLLAWSEEIINYIMLLLSLI